MPYDPSAARHLLNGGPGPPADLMRLKMLGRNLPPWLRSVLAAVVTEHETQLAAYREALDGYEETRDRLRMLQLVLIVLLEQQGGEVKLYAGQLNEIPPGAVVGVEKLARGEGDRVPLRVYTRGPGEPPTTDLGART